MLNERIPFDSIARIKPVIAQVINGKRESMAQVMARVACDQIINGGTYTPEYKPDCGLKIEGIEIGHAEYFGLGSNDEKTLEFSYAGTWTRDFMGAYKDYIRDGVYKPTLNDNALRGRTGIGITDKELVVVSIADTDKAYRCTSTYFMKKYFVGCKHAINLDGGSSSQGKGLFWNYSSGRFVLWYFCIWLKTKTIPCTAFNVRTWLAVRDRPSFIYKERGRAYTGDLLQVKEWLGSYARIVYNGADAYATARYLKRL